jgi:hypothetical protein
MLVILVSSTLSWQPAKALSVHAQFQPPPWRAAVTDGDGSSTMSHFGDRLMGRQLVEK